MRYIFCSKLIVRLSLTFLLVGSVFCLSISLHAQEKFSDNLKITANYQKGLVLPEYNFINYLAQDYVQAVELNIARETYGENIWHNIYRFPEYGVSFYYANLGNEDALGREVALTYFFKIPFLIRKNFRAYNNLGIGLGYVSKKFDLENNYLNVAVGSHFNIHFNYRLGMNYDISDKVGINAGLSFDHFSNANTGEPNLGINYVTAFSGISYRVGQKKEYRYHELDPHVKRNEVMLFANIGGKHTRSLSSEYFFTSSLSLDVNRSITRVFHLGLGADVFYDTSVKSQLEDMNKEHQGIDNFQSGIHFTQTLVYNKFSISIQEGIYLLLQDRVGANVMYNRGIIQYKMTENLSLRLAMKSHLHILDYPELGVGIKL